MKEEHYERKRTNRSEKNIEGELEKGKEDKQYQLNVLVKRSTFFFTRTIIMKSFIS